MIGWFLLAWLVGTFPAAYLHGWIVRGWPNRKGEEPTGADATDHLVMGAVLWPLIIPALLVALLIDQVGPWRRLNRAGYARRARKQPR